MTFYRDDIRPAVFKIVVLAGGCFHLKKCLCGFKKAAAACLLHRASR